MKPHRRVSSEKYTHLRFQFHCDSEGAGGGGVQVRRMKSVIKKNHIKILMYTDLI